MKKNTKDRICCENCRFLYNHYVKTFEGFKKINVGHCVKTKDVIKRTNCHKCKLHEPKQIVENEEKEKIEYYFEDVCKKINNIYDYINN